MEIVLKKYKKNKKELKLRLMTRNICAKDMNSYLFGRQCMNISNFGQTKLLYDEGVIMKRVS